MPNPPDVIWLHVVEFANGPGWTTVFKEPCDAPICTRYLKATPLLDNAAALRDAAKALLDIADERFDPSEFAPGIADEIQKVFDALLEVVNRCEES